jgi:hypothetical protein
LGKTAINCASVSRDSEQNANRRVVAGIEPATASRPPERDLSGGICWTSVTLEKQHFLRIDCPRESVQIQPTTGDSLVKSGTTYFLT